MQLSYFTDGGYVVHKAYCNGVKHSVWFDGDGNIKDAEAFDRLGRPRKVKPTSAAWKHLQAVYGKRENFEDWHQPHCLHNSATA